MTDEYVLMCKDSPVQKEWEPAYGQKTISLECNYLGHIIDFNKKNYPKFPDNLYDLWTEKCTHVNVLLGEDIIWLPTQEDWQEMRGCSHSRLGRWMIANLSLLYDFKMHNTDTKFSSDYWTIIWCLFVHKEVYSLVWDWEDNKWVKE